MAIFGEDDLNVNAKHSFKIYNKILKESDHQNYQVHKIPNATHGILNSKKYNYTKWPLSAKIRYFIEGKNAYNPQFFELLRSWVQDKK